MIDEPVIRNSSIMDAAKQVFQSDFEFGFLKLDDKDNNSEGENTDPYPAPSVEPTQEAYPGPIATSTPYPTRTPRVLLTPTFAPTETMRP